LGLFWGLFFVLNRIKRKSKIKAVDINDENFWKKPRVNKKWAEIKPIKKPAPHLRKICAGE